MGQGSSLLQQSSCQISLAGDHLDIGEAFLMEPACVLPNNQSVTNSITKKMSKTASKLFVTASEDECIPVHIGDGYDPILVGHATNLTKCETGIRHMNQQLSRQDTIEALIGKGKGLHIHFFEMQVFRLLGNKTVTQPILLCSRRVAPGALILSWKPGV